ASGNGLSAELLKKSVAQVALHDHRIATREKHIKDLEALLEDEIGMKKAAKAKNLKLAKELEDLRMRFSDLEVSNAQTSFQKQTTLEQVVASMDCPQVTKYKALISAVTQAGDYQLFVHNIN
ncbi:hypothetical protein Tco_1299805, partial [Tanacetum coccineum]